MSSNTYIKNKNKQTRCTTKLGYIFFSPSNHLKKIKRKECSHDNQTHDHQKKNAKLDKQFYKTTTYPISIENNFLQGRMLL